jgi:hypothetical protein
LTEICWFLVELAASLLNLLDLRSGREHVLEKYCPEPGKLTGTAPVVGQTRLGLPPRDLADPARQTPRRGHNLTTLLVRER